MLRLHIERYESRKGFFQKLEYGLKARLFCPALELQTIRNHNLGRTVMYEVPEVEAHKREAQRAHDRFENRSVFSSKEPGGIFSDLASEIYHNAKAYFCFTVTVADAIEGISITCPDLNTLVECERDIQSAFDALEQSVQNALAFETGRQQVFAPDGTEEPEGVQPADWGNPQRWFTHR